MDYNSYKNNSINQPNNPSHSALISMEIAALVLGIISLSTCTCLYTGIICGALAAIFASLSRGGQDRMSPRAKAGFWLGIAGIGLTAILYIVAYIIAILQYGSLEGIFRAYCDMYGIDFDSLYGNYFS